MNQVNVHNSRVLAVAPSTRGFGYTILEGRDILVDWGVKSVKSDSLAMIKEIIETYQVQTVVMELKPRYRSPRIQLLSKRIAVMARRCKVEVLFMPRIEVRRAFLGDKEGTRYQVAEILAHRFPEELGFRLPPARQCWKGEDYRMTMFDAAALAFAVVLGATRRDAYGQG
jgi:hypothetical protein